MRSFLFLSIFILLTSLVVNGISYDDTQRIFDTVLDKSRYNTNVRPILNQSNPIVVTVSFELLSITEVNDITQSFVCNGVLNIYWYDERAWWNASEYGGQVVIHPSPNKIWRPRLILVNTMDERDLFEGDMSPTKMHSDGSTSWFPGGLFPVSCKLNLRKYPFDEQECIIKMLPMAMTTEELMFKAGHTATTVFTVNGAWELQNLSIETSVEGIKNLSFSFFEVKVKIKRRPEFFLLNVMLPVVLLSFLNILVFVIPVDSGEKIGYGITVLLALTVFLSIVSSLLPQASDVIPSVCAYLFSLLIVSVLTVIDTIIIVFLHHMEEREEESMKATRRFKSAVSDINIAQKNVKYIKTGAHWKDDPLASDVKMRQSARKACKEVEDMERRQSVGIEASSTNKYKTIGKHIDLVSFIIFIVVWIVVTAWIFIEFTT